MESWRTMLWRTELAVENKKSEPEMSKNNANNQMYQHRKYRSRSIDKRFPKEEKGTQIA